MSLKTPQEYREKVTSIKTIKLPSGLECIIRPVPTLVILELTQQAENSKVSLDDYMKSNFVEALNKVVPSSVVSPTLRPARDPDEVLLKTDENALFLDELIIGDLNELFIQIVHMSGISKEDIEGYESFPKQ